MTDAANELETPPDGSGDDVKADVKAKPLLRLRPEHIPVTRLSRKALIALGGGFAIIIGAAAIFALQSGEGGLGPTELFAVNQKPSAESLAALPKDYSAIPKLGPPLPGDLGKPILDAGAQYQLPPPQAAPPVDPAIAERERQRQAALASRLFTESKENNQAALSAASSPTTVSVGSENAPANEQIVSKHRLQKSASPYLVQSGSVISAALVTGVRSDVPGQVTAQITQNIFDSLTGKIMLIPQGAKLVGSYQSNVGFGQNRLAIIWTRLNLPNGNSLILDELPASDAEGFAGLQDGVDHHFDRLALAAGLSTLLSVGSHAGSAGDSDIARAIRDGVSDTAGRTGEEIVARQLAVPPTITIKSGFPVRVIVSRDLVLEPYLKE